MAQRKILEDEDLEMDLDMDMPPVMTLKKQNSTMAMFELSPKKLMRGGMALQKEETKELEDEPESEDDFVSDDDLDMGEMPPLLG